MSFRTRPHHEKGHQSYLRLDEGQLRRHLHQRSRSPYSLSSRPLDWDVSYLRGSVVILSRLNAKYPISRFGHFTSRLGNSSSFRALHSFCFLPEFSFISSSFNSTSRVPEPSPCRYLSRTVSLFILSALFSFLLLSLCFPSYSDFRTVRTRAVPLALSE